ncbi:hypothetical protein SAMN06265377_3158 [Flagellimonas pacifica]|uniref:Uncharacterized protein n=1 Tax=Flagellimonas pacifica TaxID=1247520 RepID=A0A285MVU7_9FLAO|nr:hypothetical protein SAMN06265377_3158 [Allomuricauda parva]
MDEGIEEKERKLQNSESVSWQKEGLYILISILILFGIHILITLLLYALLEP